jgi:hypothetical protein
LGISTVLAACVFVLRVLGAPMSIGSDVEITTRPDMFVIIRTTLETQRNIVL